MYEEAQAFAQKRRTRTSERRLIDTMFRLPSSLDDDNDAPERGIQRIDDAPPVDEIEIPVETTAPARPVNRRAVPNPPRNTRHDFMWGGIQQVTASTLRSIALSHVGFDKSRQRGVRDEENTDRFKEHFGPPPAVLAVLFNDLKAKFPDLTFKHTLMALNWMKCYHTERVLSGIWQIDDLAIIRQTVKEYVQKIASLFDAKIIFGGFEDDDMYPIAIDGMHATTNEFRHDPSTSHYDFKSNSAGVKYEFALALRRPAIVHMNGPFKASVHDITIFRGGNDKTAAEDWDKGALIFKMERFLCKGAKAIGDSGYDGEPDKVLVSKPGQSKELREFIARAKNREETLHSRFKSWNILSNRFRHGHGTEERTALHGTVMKAITVITQYDYENGRPPFEVR